MSHRDNDDTGSVTGEETDQTSGRAGGDGDGAPQYECPHCGEPSDATKFLFTHIAEEHGTDSCPFPDCESDLDGEGELKTHLANVHGSELAETTPSTETTEGDDEPATSSGEQGADGSGTNEPSDPDGTEREAGTDDGDGSEQGGDSTTRIPVRAPEPGEREDTGEDTEASDPEETADPGGEGSVTGDPEPTGDEAESTGDEAEPTGAEFVSDDEPEGERSEGGHGESVADAPADSNGDDEETEGGSTRVGDEAPTDSTAAEEATTKSEETAPEERDEEEADVSAPVSPDRTEEVDQDTPDEANGEPGPDGEVEWPREDIEALERRVDELEQLFSEYKDRNEREHEEIRRYSIEPFANDMLRIRDTLQRAVRLGDWDEADEKRLRSIVNQFDQQFTNRDIAPIDPERGDEFDPGYHEAIGQEETEEFVEERVLRVERRGFVLDGRVIRPAKVVVSERD